MRRFATNAWMTGTLAVLIAGCLPPFPAGDLQSARDDGSGDAAWAPDTAGRSGLWVSRVEVLSDTNDDGKPNRGERVCLRVYVWNSTSGEASGVVGEASTSDALVSMEDSEVTYSSLDRGAQSAGYYSGDGICFSLGDKTPADHPVEFAFRITDDRGGTWDDAFTVTVVATDAGLAISQVAVASDTNDDGKANRGERVCLKVYVKNDGASAALGVVGTAATSDPYASMEDSEVTYSTLDAGSESAGYYSSDFICFSLTDKTPENHEVAFSYRLVDDHGNEWADAFTVTVEATSAAVAVTKAVITSDSNDDGEANQGERVCVKVYVKNNGTGAALGVTGKASTSDLYASMEDSEVSYSAIDPGSESAGYYSSDFICFSLTDKTPAGHPVAFTFRLADDNGNEWVDGFTIMTEATGASLTVTRTAIVSDGNDNGVANPGERVCVKVHVRNGGTSAALGVTGKASTSDPLASIEDSEVSYSDLDPGSESPGYYSSDFICLSIQDTAPAGHAIDVAFRLVDRFANAWSSNLEVTVR